MSTNMNSRFIRRNDVITLPLNRSIISITKLIRGAPPSKQGTKKAGHPQAARLLIQNQIQITPPREAS